MYGNRLQPGQSVQVRIYNSTAGVILKIYAHVVYKKKVIFLKLFLKFFYVYLLLKKLINEKHFSVKEKFSLVSRKVFS